MIDNFELLSTFFDKLVDKDDFYFVEVMQRKKDGVNLPTNTHGARVVRSFYFFNKEDFMKRADYIKQLCIDNHARAYFWVNPRNTVDVACESIKQFAEIIKTGNSRMGMSVYDSATGGSRSNHYEKLWILDIDTKDEDYIRKVVDIMNSCRGRDTEGNRVKHVIPTKSGYHLITSAFDRGQFAQELAINKIEPVDIHDNNPTLLYYNTDTTFEEKCLQYVEDFKDLMCDMTTPLCGEEYLTELMEFLENGRPI